MKSSCNHHDSENLQLKKKEMIKEEKTQNEQPIIHKWPSASEK